MRIVFALALAGAAAGSFSCAGRTGAPSLSSVSSSPPMSLDKVVLYQNGIGHFEHTGKLTGGRFRLWLRPHEVDDVLKTLTVIDRRGQTRTVSAMLPTTDSKGDRVAIDIALAGEGEHDLSVAYAVPTSAWKATYRVALDEGEGDPAALLQAWAIVDNVSERPWTRVRLTLATGAPMSFATNLRAPRFVARPDASGNLTRPVVEGVVHGERVGHIDEDRDGIADLDDSCPQEPENFNGNDDDDGCPDRGRVVVTSSELVILDKIYFRDGSAEIPAEARPIIDAIAMTLRGHPELTKIMVQGHAAPGEDAAWSLSARRALAVRAALMGHGVDAARLEARPFGATMPIAAGKDASSMARNRRAEFEILERPDTEAAPAPVGAPTARALAGSVRAGALPSEVAGAVRYAISDPVTVPRGKSTMVSILSQRVSGEDVLLYRPDPAVPGSSRHPMRAARLKNQSGFSLEPGPVAIFARGSFVGEGTLGRLAEDETAFVPYAVDGSAEVELSGTAGEEPVRLVSFVRGVFTVENSVVQTTRYQIRAGKQSPRTIYLRHSRKLDHTISGLPPGALPVADGWLVPVPLSPGKTSTLELVERRPVQRELAIMGHGHDAIEVYLGGAHLPSVAADKIKHVLGLRKSLARAEQQIDTSRRRIMDLAQRAEELRETLRTVAKTAGAAELRKRLLARLDDATRDGDTASRELGTASATAAEQRALLQEALETLTLPALDETQAAATPR